MQEDFVEQKRRNTAPIQPEAPPAGIKKTALWSPPDWNASTTSVQPHSDDAVMVKEEENEVAKKVKKRGVKSKLLKLWLEHQMRIALTIIEESEDGGDLAEGIETRSPRTGDIVRRIIAEWIGTTHVQEQRQDQEES